MTACPRSARRAVALALASALLALAPLVAAAATTPLYDPALGSLPSAQGWLPLALGAPAGQSVDGGVYALDTTGAGVSYWGNRFSNPLRLAVSLSPVPEPAAALLTMLGLTTGLAGLALRRR